MADSYDDIGARADQLAQRRARRGEVTEDSLALTFCAAEPTLRYVALWNRWMTWTGTTWREDDTLAVYDRIRAHVRRTTDNDRDWMKAGVVAAVERMAKADRRYAATADQWDTCPWLLNTPSGIVDLRSGALEASDPDQYMTKSTAASPGGNCPAWLRFLEEITQGDRDYIEFIRRVFGYCASGSVREHAMFFGYGPGGNGKGTLLNTVQRIMGDYATVASMETFTDSHADRHPTDLAMLRGARLVLAQETEEGRAWAESRIKALTGGDPITARYMRQDFFTFEPTFKLFVAGNHKPRLKNVDEAIKRRLYLLPFMVTFKADQRDPDLPEKLMAEAGGILQWIIDGAASYHREGLNPPKVVTDATDQYFAAENLFEQWLEDCCEVAPDRWERPSALFNAWKRYADAANVRPGSQNTFAEHLDNAGFPAGNSRARGGRFREGLALKATEEPESAWN
ncbi:MAG: hypothetical protein CMN57_05120 [Gammaproteobacteria bacterium]|nr:hypothetical protein [Gammaproteobacteria bacterium]|tara:strand:- start:7456 stop:8820 length:1365 start_codon:yes stop_codon:yes gene_type:complete